MILVTGGAGYIGSHTAIRLIEKGMMSLLPIISQLQRKSV